MITYRLEFILNTYNGDLATIKNSLLEFGSSLVVDPLQDADESGGCNFKINVHTEDPTVIFDICGQFGRIKSVKVEET